jgi:hypothetical protein
MKCIRTDVVNDMVGARHDATWRGSVVWVGQKVVHQTW